MKGDKKCFGLLLALFIMVGLSLNVFSIDTNALKYEYMGVPFLSPVMPANNINCGYELVDGSYRSPSSGFSYNNCFAFGGSLTDRFSLEFYGDSYDSSYRDLQLKGSSSFMSVGNDNSYTAIRPIFFNAPSPSSPSSEFPNNYIGVSPYNEYFDTRIWDSSSLSSSQLNQQRRPLSNFNSDSIPLGLMRCDPFGYFSSGVIHGNDAICPFTWATRDYVSSQILPYWYTSDGFYIHSKAISSETGLSYSNTFSFYNMFNNYIPTFSRLTIPLWDYDNLYFANADNMYDGRHLDFNGAFEFDGSFEWHDNIQNNGSYFRVNYFGVSDSVQSNNQNNLQIYSGSFDCNTNLITISGLTRLEYSCPFDLPDTFNFISFSLDISGNGNYVWRTDKEWRFAYSFLTTDNDDSYGGTFNSQLTGGGYIAGDAQNLIPDSDNIMVDADSIDNVFANFTDYLSNLFVFNLFNPFGFIFNLFSDSNSCAQIPTLSGMLHSEETEVCPYFDSTVRNILTPVISIVSTMLLFGFILRWIRSSSSDFSPEVIGGK